MYLLVDLPSQNSIDESFENAFAGIEPVTGFARVSRGISGNATFT